MNVIIFYEHLVREWDASQKLKKVFEEHGDRAVVHSIIFERFKAYRDAKRNVPDIIFVPWFVDKEHEELLSIFMNLNPNVKIINLHQEEIGSKKSEDMMLPHTAYTANGSFHFVWGEYFKKRLLEAGVREENIVVTGNVRNDLRGNVHISKKDLSEQYGLDVDKKWVLFAENRGWLLGRDTKNVREIMASRGMNDEQFDKCLEKERVNIEAFVDQLRALDEKFETKFELVYRPHPGTVLKYDVPSCVHIIGDRSIYDWIACCDLFLTCESTSIFEAEMSGKPCAIVPSIIEPDEESKMAGVWDYPRIADVKEINDELISDIENRNRKAGQIYARYLGLVDGNAASRVYQSSKNIMSVTISDSDKTISHATGKQLIRQYLYEKTTWLMVKLNLFERFKLPRSAYTEKRDIPYSPENAWINIRGGVAPK